MLILMASQGRRPLVFTLIIYVIFTGLSVRDIKYDLKTLVIITSIIIISYFGTKLYQAMRIAGYSNIDANLYDLFISGIEIIKDPKSVNLDENISENLLDRPFVIQYIAIIIEKISINSWSWGINLINSALWTVPRFFLANKNFITDEELLVYKLGLPATDESFSIFASGLADFGILGMLFFPTLYVILLKSIFLKTIKYFDPAFKIIIYSSLLYILLNVESSTLNYISLFRSLFIIYILYSVTVYKLFFIHEI